MMKKTVVTISLISLVVLTGLGTIWVVGMRSRASERQAAKLQEPQPVAVLDTPGATAELELEIEKLTQRGPVRGEVKGEAVCTTPVIWWMPLVIQFAVTLIFLLALGKGKPMSQVVWVPLLIALFSQISHWLIGCPCAESNLCPWYWALNLAILLASLAVYYFTLRKQPQSQHFE